MFTALLAALVIAAQEEAPPAEVEQPVAVAQPRDEAKLRPLGLTVSGGVSLGTWESGFIYFFSEAAKLRPTAQLRVVTGASAGSANALIAAISSCQPSNPLPMSSLAWNVWGPVGFKELFDRQRSNADALFIRDELDRSFERVRGVWNQGLPTDCDVVFGATVTRVKPREVKLKEGLAVPRVLETFVVRIQGRGPGKAPKLSNYVSPDTPMPMPLLPFVDDSSDPVASDRNFSQLRSVLFASSAFPLAFAPSPIEYCLSKPVASGEQPTAKTVECLTPEFVDLFVDGGVFDNNPLRLAWMTADQHLRRNARGGSSWETMLEPSTHELRDDTHFIYLDPDSSNYPAESSASEEAAANGFLAKLFSLGGGLIDSARARELSLLAREQKGISERMELAPSNLPKASEPLSAFVGFFETEFRRFDFYLGMYDAFSEMSAKPDWKEAPVEFEPILAIGPEVRGEWAPFLCMVSMMEPQYAKYRSACDDPELIDFRILLQTSIDRLYDVCRPTKRKLSTGPDRYNHLCSEARRGGEPPAVPHVAQLPLAQRRRQTDEASFDYFMRLLGAYGFRFTDLGLPRGESHNGTLALRRELDAVVDAWATAQPTLADRVLARTVARAGLNSIHFSPPVFSTYAVLGTMLEGGASFAPFNRKARWLQVHSAVTLNYLFSAITDPKPRFAVNLTAGPEAHLSFISNTIFQPRVAVRGGVQLGVLDTFASTACVTSDPRGCTQPVVDLVLTLSLLERLRIELVWQTYPLLYATQHSSSNLHLGVGAQFY